MNAKRTRSSRNTFDVTKKKTGLINAMIKSLQDRIPPDEIVKVSLVTNLKTWPSTDSVEYAGAHHVSVCCYFVYLFMFVCYCLLTISVLHG